MLFRSATHPKEELALPADLEPAALLEAVALGGPVHRLWVVADGWAAEALSRAVERFQQELPMAVQALDPVAMGWLQGEAHGFASSGVDAVPWTLWGLAAPAVVGSADPA